ncbi:hypothetical protein LTR36_002889 [Oleoguttula mirabilis]|uniref:Uncharacterized protein n=1 Tax=Oleoguttula mirabilis TaxID=1507867 RepID=A0AAV9JJD9_9PEZI|nr:hypothetical protein LTR36_002889 [Oleoguttula mirabilis]
MTPAARLERVGEFSWVGRLVGQLVEVQLARTLDDSADDAIRTYSEFRAVKATIPASRSISDAAASAQFSRNLRRRYHNTNSALYDWWIDKYCMQSGDDLEHFQQMKLSKQLQLAQLSLLHPRSPNPELAMRIFEMLENTPHHRSNHPSKASECRYMQRFTGWLEAELRKQKRSEEAERVREYYEKTFPAELYRQLEAQKLPSSRASPPTEDGRAGGSDVRGDSGDGPRENDARGGR